MKILYLEDNQQEAALVSRYLRTTPHEFRIVANLDEARNAVEEAPELIFVDLVIGPTRDGYTFIQELRAGGRQQSQGNGQVEGGAGLANVGGGQIHGDAVVGKLEPRVANRRPYAVPAFAHRGVRQADHREVRQAEGHVDLDQNGKSVYPEHRGAPKAGKHIDGCARRRSRPQLMVFRTKSPAGANCVQISETPRSPIRGRSCVALAAGSATAVQTARVNS